MLQGKMAVVVHFPWLAPKSVNTHRCLKQKNHQKNKNSETDRCTAKCKLCKFVWLLKEVNKFFFNIKLSKDVFLLTLTIYKNNYICSINL